MLTWHCSLTHSPVTPRWHPSRLTAELCTWWPLCCCPRRGCAPQCLRSPRQDRASAAAGTPEAPCSRLGRHLRAHRTAGSASVSGGWTSCAENPSSFKWKRKRGKATRRTAESHVRGPYTRSGRKRGPAVCQMIMEITSTQVLRQQRALVRRRPVESWLRGLVTQDGQSWGEHTHTHSLLPRSCSDVFSSVSPHCVIFTSLKRLKERNPDECGGRSVTAVETRVHFFRFLYWPKLMHLPGK